MGDRKLCLVMEIGGENRVFLVDLKADDGGELVERRPNLAIPNACFGECDAYVGDCFLYIFSCTGDGSRSLQRTVSVYKVELSTFWDKNDVKLDMSMVEKAPSILGSKSMLRVIPYAIKGYGTVFIIFSAMIMFCHNRVDDGVEIDINDFELYDPRGVFSRKLPQLNVRPKKRSGLSGSFLLLSSQTQEFLPTKHVTNDYRFRITSFGLSEENDLFIQTDFGTIFSLRFKDGKNWMVWGEGPEFPYDQMNFVNRRNGLRIDSYGINDFRMGLKSMGGLDRARRRYVDFPKSSMDGLQCDGGLSNTVALLEQGLYSVLPIVSQIGYEPTMMSWKKMFCYVDVFFVDLAACREWANEGCLEGDDEENEMTESGKRFLVRRIKSIKFSLKNELVLWASMVGMYPL